MQIAVKIEKVTKKISLIMFYEQVSTSITMSDETVLENTKFCSVIKATKKNTNIRIL